MTEPTIAGRGPWVGEVEAGEKAWCACGRSANQPWCDGSHRGTGLVPVRFSLPAGRKVALCLCKRTKNPPYCDGSHRGLPAEA